MEGLFAVYIGEQHVLTKEICGKEGKNYFPNKVLVPFGNFIVREENEKIVFEYKFLPFYDILYPMKGSKEVYKGEMYVYEKKWFDFALYPILRR